MDHKILETQIGDFLQAGHKVQAEVIKNGLAQIAAICQLLIDVFRADHKLVIFGNGGSAADAQHIAAELIGRLSLNRKALPAIALTTDTSILTSVANDWAYDQIFERQVQALVRSGDIAVGLSTSGTSANVIQGLIAARAQGAHTIVFTGQSGGQLALMVDLCFIVPSESTPYIQEATMAVWHAICQVVETKLFFK